MYEPDTATPRARPGVSYTSTTAYGDLLRSAGWAIRPEQPWRVGVGDVQDLDQPGAVVDDIQPAVGGHRGAARRHVVGWMVAERRRRPRTVHLEEVDARRLVDHRRQRSGERDVTLIAGCVPGGDERGCRRVRQVHDLQTGHMSLIMPDRARPCKYGDFSSATCPAWDRFGRLFWKMLHKVAHGLPPRNSSRSSCGHPDSLTTGSVCAHSASSATCSRVSLGLGRRWRRDLILAGGGRPDEAPGHPAKGTCRSRRTYAGSGHSVLGSSGQRPPGRPK